MAHSNLISLINIIINNTKLMEVDNMILTFKNGKTFKVDNVQEILNEDGNSFTLNIFSKDISIPMQDIVSLITQDNLSSITISDNDGNVVETHTVYTKVLTAQKSVNDKNSGIDIRLCNPNTYTGPV